MTTPVVVTFNEVVNPATVTDYSIIVQEQSNSYYHIAGSYAVSGSTVTFTPTSPFPAGATIQVVANYASGVQDLAGNSGSQATASFTTATTADTTQPTVVSVTPSKGATGIGLNGQVVLTFSKSMSPASLSACCTTGNYSNVYLLAGSTRIGFYESMSPDNRMLTLYGFTLPPSPAAAEAASAPGRGRAAAR